MTPEQQRMAIAEACGWKREFNGDHEDPDWYYIPPNDPDGSGDPPDYLNDLNAMHEAVDCLGISDRRWSDVLMNVIRDDPAWTSGAVEARYRTARATAAQRAEAFLRTIGKWT